MSMTKEPFNDRDEQAAWELLGRHKAIEPSFGFAERTLRRLDETPARPRWWRLPMVRWAGGLSLAFIVATGMIRWHSARETHRAEVYASAQQDALEDFDVIASLDQLNGDQQL